MSDDLTEAEQAFRDLLAKPKDYAAWARATGLARGIRGHGAQLGGVRAGDSGGRVRLRLRAPT